MALGCLLALLLIPIGYRSLWADSIFPGVHVSGVDVGGMTPSEATDVLTAAGLDPAQNVDVRAADQRWTLSPDVIALDLEATIERALAQGRRGARLGQIADMVRLRIQPRTVLPVIRFDEREAARRLQSIAGEIDREMVDARVTIIDGEVRATEAITGRRLLTEPSLAILRDAAAQGDWPPDVLEFPVEVTRPTVHDATPALERARALLAGPVELAAFNESWTLQPADLAPLLMPREDDGAVHLEIATDQFGRLIQPVIEAVSRTARAPRFGFEPESATLRVEEPTVTGRAVNVARTARRVLGMPTDGERKVHVALDFVEPEIGEDVTAEELGIRELVHEATSYYQGSSPGRIHNVGLAASKFDGLLIPPGATFSFNENVGDITAEEGYEETLIILDGATADGVGGGVCQVSTTLYRAAFWSGLPIVERLAHGYRVAYYEQNSPTGMDATVYGPIIDLKFENDTGSWLLIESEADPVDRTLTFRLWGTKPDREVKMVGPHIADTVPPPPPEVEVDPELAPGETRTVELAREGMSVSVERIIIENGEERKKTFYSNYRPTGAITAVGPTPPPTDGPESLENERVAASP